MRREEVYNGKGKEPVLVLLLELYSKLDIVLVDTSEHSSCSTLHYLLTTVLIELYMILI